MQEKHASGIMSLNHGSGFNSSLNHFAVALSASLLRTYISVSGRH